MSTALFVNGMFKDILDRIRKIQQAAPGAPGYLQPHNAHRIKLLAESDPSHEHSITAYFSLTDSLGTVSYRANIVGWHDKGELAKNQELFDKINLQIKESQQEENGLYLTADNGKPCVNLISVRDVAPLESPFPVSCLIKTSDGKPLKKRTEAGGWSPVREQPEWLGTISQVVKGDVDAELKTEVSNSMKLSTAERQQRLAVAPKFPEHIEVVSRAFRRNPDVIAEIRGRANGICEECNAPAPFYRASDNTPYLEVHHRKMLSEGGEDTVINAMAVCPNCHRKLHFGKTDEAN